MDDSAIQTRIFLVGCPRSGTTLLQSLLARHPAIATFPESHFFPKLIPSHEPRRRRYHLASRQIKPHLIQFAQGIGADNPERLIRPWTQFQFQYIHAFTRLLDHVTRDRGKSIWLEKTPDHYQYIPLIKRHIPKAQFIHILRNGPDTIASLYEVTHQYPQYWGGKPWSLDTCIEKWLHAATTSLKYYQHPCHTLITYEQLTTHPEESLRHLYQTIGVDTSPLLHPTVPDSSPPPSTFLETFEAWKFNATQPIATNQSNKFQRLFSSIEQDNILGRTESLMEKVQHLTLSEGIFLSNQ